jgi:hypothetical protein
METTSDFGREVYHSKVTLRDGEGTDQTSPIPLVAVIRLVSDEDCQGREALRTA